MSRDTRPILEEVRSGVLTTEEALLELKQKPFTDIDYAKVDVHRRIRQGVPEIIYGEGKTSQQIIGILRAMEEAGLTLDADCILRSEATGQGIGRRVLRKLRAGGDFTAMFCFTFGLDTSTWTTGFLTSAHSWTESWPSVIST